MNNVDGNLQDIEKWLSDNVFPGPAHQQPIISLKQDNFVTDTPFRIQDFELVTSDYASWPNPAPRDDLDYQESK